MHTTAFPSPTHSAVEARGPHLLLRAAVLLQLLLLLEKTVILHVTIS